MADTAQVATAASSDDPSVGLRAVRSLRVLVERLEALMRMCAATGVRPVIDVELPLEEAREGFARMLEGRTAGKIVFTL